MMMTPGFILLFGMHVYANHNTLLLNTAIYIDVNGTAISILHVTFICISCHFNIGRENICIWSYNTFVKNKKQKNKSDFKFKLTFEDNKSVPKIWTEWRLYTTILFTKNSFLCK